MTAIQKKYKNTVKIEASTTRSTSTTNFVIKGSNEAAVKAAKKELTVSLAKRVSLEVMIPQSLRAFVIGSKGKNLKAITEQTGCRVNIPRTEGEATDTSAKPAAGPRDEVDYDADEQVAVVIEGDEINARQAAKLVTDLVAERTSRTTQRLINIDHTFYPFIAGPKGANATRLETQIGNGDVSVRVPPRAAFLQPKDAEDEEKEPRRERDLSIVVTGDREQVQRVVQAIETQVDEMKRSFRKLEIQVPKRQHRFLVGDAANEILETTRCSVELAPQDDPSETVLIRGPQAQLPGALGVVMEKANAVKIEVVDVVAAHRSAPDPLEHAKSILRWLSISGKLPRSQDVQVYTPRPAVVDSTGTVHIEIVGSSETAVSEARQTLEGLVKSVPHHHTDSVEVDSLLHAVLIGKKGANLKEYEKRGVDVIFPHTSASQEDARSDILLFVGPQANLSSDKKARDAEAKQLLESVKAELLKASQQAADFKTEVLPIAAKHHRAIVGPGGSTLNAVLGEERIVSVRVGNAKGQTGDEDTITVRGPSAEVDRVVNELRKIAKDAEEDAIVNGHEVSFSVDPAHVKHLVGRSGAAITKLREELNVRIDFDDAAASAANGSSKKAAPVTCKIVGRKENVEEAKKRLSSQAEKLADEREEVLKIPQNLHASIIGKGGVWVSRLQDNHGVRIEFPRQGNNGNEDGNAKREQKPDEVVVRGGKKGVAAAKSEIMELLEYEKENNNHGEVTVAAQSIARIMGKGGATINQIRDDTGAQIDIDNGDAKDHTTKINLRGTKKAIADAKAAIVAIDAEVKGEETFTLHIPSKFHGQLIGPGGQGIRDLVSRATGSDADGRSATQLVQFPRRGEQNADVVIVRGPSAVATKVKNELEAAAKIFMDRVCHGVVVTPDQQRLLIGRGGSKRSELEAKFNVRLMFPGRTEHAQEDVVNAAEVGDAPNEHLVKISGKEEDVEKMKAEISSSAASTRVVKIPRAIHSKLAQPNFFRQMRSQYGVSIDTPRVNNSDTSKPSGSLVSGQSSSASQARIDDAPEEGEEDVNGGLSFELYQLDTSADKAGAAVNWTLTAKGDSDKAKSSLDKAEAAIQKGLSEAETISHEGRLVVPESAVPRIVGKRGAGLQSIETEIEGVSVEIPREGKGLCIIRGSERAVLAARDRLVRSANQRRREEY